MRVLLISHTCQSRGEGQPKAEQLARLPDVELCVLTPNRWLHYGQWRAAQRPLDASFRFHVGRVMWPWVGPAQNYLHWYPRLDSLLRSFRPDVIDLWEEPWGLVSAHAAMLRNRLLPQSRIVSETEQNLDKKLPPPFEKFRSYTLKQADFLVGRSEEAVQVARAKGYRGASRSVPNAVDAHLFRPLNRSECRSELGLNGFVAGYVGRLVEEKGLMEMIDALPLCDPKTNLLFVGSGPHKEALEERARELNVSQRVRFLPARPLDELPRVMNALDVLVLPSRTTPSWKEQFGRVIIEAHACGTPVIGSSSGAIPEVVGEAGLIFPEGDARGLAAALDELSRDPERAHRLGEIGRARVQEKYTWERVAHQMHSIYREVLEAHGSEKQSKQGK